MPQNDVAGEVGEVAELPFRGRGTRVVVGDLNEGGVREKGKAALLGMLEGLRVGHIVRMEDYVEMLAIRGQFLRYCDCSLIGQFSIPKNKGSLPMPARCPSMPPGSLRTYAGNGTYPSFRPSCAINAQVP